MRTKLRIGGGAWIFLAFFALGGYRLLDISMLFPWLAAVILHECGHLAAAFLLGVPVREISLGLLGIRIRLDTGLISYANEAVISAAGPLVNLISFLLFRHFYYFASFSLALALINLLPAETFDGGRIAFSFSASFFGIEKAHIIMKILSFASVVFLWSIASYFLIRYGANFPLFLLSCALFALVCL